MVGREREAAALFSFLTGTPESPFIQVVGAPGSGKRRLIIGAATRAASSGAFVCVSGPDPSGLRASLYPIRSTITAILGLTDLTSRDQLISAVLDAGLSDGDLPGLLELFGHATELTELEETVRRRELLASTLRALESVATSGRAVLVFFDVELFDRPSQELLHRLADHIAADSQIRIVAAHTHELGEVWPSRIQRLELGALDERSVAKLSLHLRAHGSSALPKEADLRDRCGSMPEHILQLTRYVLEGGPLESAPDSIVDLIAERVDMLPYEAQLFAQAVAVFGSEIPISLLAKVTGEHLEEDEQEDALAVLVARGFLEDDGELVRFPQALVRDVVYDVTPSDVRRALHELVVAVTRGVVPDLLVGHHADMAGRTGEAAPLLENAGDAAVQQNDETGASELYQRALNAARLELMKAPGEDTETRYIGLAVKLGGALRATGKLVLARGILAEARSYAQALPAMTATIDRAEAALLVHEGWLERAEERVRRGLGTALQSGQTSLMCELILDLASILVRSSRTKEAIRELEEGIDLLSLGEGPSGRGGPVELWTLALRWAKIEATRDNLERSLELGEAALARALERNIGIGVTRTRAFLAEVCTRLGRHKKAIEHRERALDGLRQLGDRRGTAELLMAIANPTIEVGRSQPELIQEAKRLALEISVADDEFLTLDSVDEAPS